MRIGSGDTKKLLQNPSSKGFKDLLIEFIKDEPQHRNALNSPIHALRTGAILEEAMYLQLPDMYLFQVRVVSKEFDVLTCTLDFAIMDKGKVKAFLEMKTLNFDSFLNLNASPDKLAYIKKYFKSYYNQVQQQMLITELKQCTLRFVVVYDENNDVENRTRIFEKRDIIDVIIPFDAVVAEKIKQRVFLFQQLKDLIICQ